MNRTSRTLESAKVTVDGSGQRHESDTEIIERRKSRHDQPEAETKKEGNMEIFPWLPSFRAACKCLLSQDPLFLIKLIKLFNRNVSSNVNDCYERPSRAAKLKEHVEEAMLIFQYFRRCKPSQCDRSRTVYLEQMSDLLAVYIDLQLVASKQLGRGQLGKVIGRISTYLSLFLENSAEYLLDTLIKVQLASKTHFHILDGVISKIMKVVPAHPETQEMYLRYLLVYRLWRWIHGNPTDCKHRINVRAISSLGKSPPHYLPVFLLDKVLPTTARQQKKIHEHREEIQRQQEQVQEHEQQGDFAFVETTESTEFYLYQRCELRDARNRFLDYSRKSKADDKDSQGNLDDITERDLRIISKLTLKTTKEDSVNNEFSKNSNPVNKLKSVGNIANIPFAKLKIDNHNEKASSTIVNGSSSANAKYVNKSPILFKNKAPTNLNDIVLIDLTDDGMTKIIKQTKRRQMAWFEAVKHADLKIRRASSKDSVASNNASTIKTKDNELQDSSSGRSIEPPSAKSTELQSKSSNSSNSRLVKINRDEKEEVNNDLDKQIVVNEASDERSVTKPISAIDSPSIKEESPEKRQARTSALQHNNSMDGASDSVAREDISALSTDKEPKNESVPVDSALVSSPSPASSSAVATTSVATISVVGNVKPNILENRPVNFNVTKTDPNEQKVQQALIVEKSGLSDINESHIFAKDKVKDDGETVSVNSDQVRNKTDLTNPSDTVKHDKNDAVNNCSNKEYRLELSPSKDKIDSGLDGLTLLAQVSTILQDNFRNGNACQKVEIKVKPFSRLQDKMKNKDVTENDQQQCAADVGDCSSADKQGSLSSAELTSSSAAKNQQQQQQQQQHAIASLDGTSYIFDESIQNNWESNDNVSAILNGETIMLVQRPNSNLFIINKADYYSKVNYNRDEDGIVKKIEVEEKKCYPQGIAIKHEPEEADPRSRAIKPDPDYMDVKSGALIHEDSIHQNQSQAYDLHYAGYAVPPPALVTAHCAYPNIHHPSAACPCVNCTYYYRPHCYLSTTHPAPTVQTNPAVQDKLCNKNTEPAAPAKDKLYDADQTHCNSEKIANSDGKQQQLKKTDLETEKQELGRKCSNFDSQLPLKKRMKSLCWAAPEYYPGVQIRDESVPQDIGAMVEVNSTTCEPTKSKSSRANEKKSEGKTSNQNVSNCFPRKRSITMRRLDLAEDEVENKGVSKKQRQSNNMTAKQTRVSKRIIPPVNYEYPGDVDPEWNPSGKRKRRKRTR